jgi:transposase
MASTTKQDRKSEAIDWRRDKVLELTVQGYSQREIAKLLQVGNGTIAGDQKFLRQKAKENIREYLNERLPDEYERCMAGINAILKEAWTTSQSTEDKREKLQALSLAKDCYSTKMDLLTNATVVDDAIRFVCDKSKDKEKLRPSVAAADDVEQDKEESNMPDYHEDQDQLEEEEEEEAGEISSSTTINQIF